MKLLINIAQVYLLFFGASGYLLGQLFFATFSWSATIAGLAGILAAALAQPKSPLLRRLAIVACVAGVIAIVVETADYYANLNIPGNSFGWFLKAPYIAALALIAWANRRVPSLLEH